MIIVSSYALHHLTDTEKVELVNVLKSKLTEKGKIIIADVAFAIKEAFNECRRKAGEPWDEDEHYIIFEDFKDNLDKLNLKVK